MEKYQTFWLRLIAYIADSLIIFPLSFLFSIILSAFFKAPRFYLFMLTGFLPVCYYVVMHAYFGQTAGKMAFKTRVLTEKSETRINFGQAVMRSFPLLIPVMFAISISTADRSAGSSAEFWERTIYALSAAFFLIDALVCAASAKNRAIHDMIARTIVVRTDV